MIEKLSALFTWLDVIWCLRETHIAILHQRWDIATSRAMTADEKWAIGNIIYGCNPLACRIDLTFSRRKWVAGDVIEKDYLPDWGEADRWAGDVLVYEPMSQSRLMTLSSGVIAVTRYQAERAAKFGWEITRNSPYDGLWEIRR